MSDRTARLVVATGAILLALAPAVSAQETSGFEKNGIYVGASEVPDFNLDGVTFNGSTYYRSITGNNEVMILPKLEPKSTIRAIGGYRLTRGSFEVSYERTNHEGTFLGQTGQATFQALNFDERIYALTRRRVQPYGLLGLSLPRLTVKDGAAVGDQVGDGSFRGFGLNSEAGATVFPVPRVGVSVGYRYRLMWFDSAEGVSRTTYDLRPRFRETAGSVSISATVTF